MGTSPQSFWNSIQFDQATFGGTSVRLGYQSVSGLIYAALRKAAVTLGRGARLRRADPGRNRRLRRLTAS
jgi:hypothetical protein